MVKSFLMRFLGEMTGSNLVIFRLFCFSTAADFFVAEQQVGRWPCGKLGIYIPLYLYSKLKGKWTTTWLICREKSRENKQVSSLFNNYITVPREAEPPFLPWYLIISYFRLGI